MLGIGYQFEPRLCSSNRKVTFFPSLSVSLSLSPLAFSTRNSALARIFSLLLFIHQRFIAVFTRGVSRPRVEKKKKKKKGLISDGYKAAPFLAGFGNMTNHAPVTQQKLPLQVRSEKRSIPEFLHVAALSLFPSTSNLGVAGTGAGRISKFRMYSRNKGRCLFSSLLLFALIIGDTRDYFPSPACKITIVACAIIVYTVKDGTFPRVLCTCFHL